MTESELIQCCIKQDRSAQKLIYKTYAPVLLGMCMRYVVDRSEAEDILQEGFVKVFTHISSFTGVGSFEGWLKKIMINTAITYYHKNLKRRYHYDIEEMYDLQSEEVEFGDADYTHEELLKVIADLPDGYRMVFNLYAIEGYKHKEIAEMMGIDINTSKSQFSRARKLLQKKLEEINIGKHDKKR